MQNAELFDPLPPFLTRRENKLRSRKKNKLYRKHPSDVYNEPKLSLKKITPLTENQRKTFEAFKQDKNLLLHGSSGAGKTFLGLYLALNAISINKISKPIVILRSVVPSRDIGFLPGKIEDKIAVYEEPYYSLCHELTGKPTAYDYFKQEGIIEFSTTSFLRGLTFKNNIVLIDEIQNCNAQEINTIMTRIGDGCRVIVCGDFTQTDLKNNENTGFINFMNIAKNMPSFEHIEFTQNDIVRGPFVKEYLIAKEQLGF